MRTQSKLIAGTLWILSLVGCDGTSDSIVSPGTPITAESNASTSRTEKVARAFALAMRREDIRAQVRNALRASPWTEHKLLLQSFVTTPAGRHLVRAAAEAAGTEPAQIQALVAELPLMDFYVPIRGHRLSWRGTADVSVAATLLHDPEVLTGYRTDGSATIYDLRNGPPTEALLVMHPAERKSRRIRPQADRPGLVIQDADDGELSGTLLWTGADGRPYEMDRPVPVH